MRDASDEGVNCFKEIEMDEIMGKGLLQLHPQTFLLDGVGDAACYS